MKTYLLEIKYEFLKALRMPQYSLPTLLFPIVFYVFFGVMFSGKTTGGVEVGRYMLATYGAFGVIGAALFGFGVSIAVERGQGWLEAKRTTPMPIAAYFVAKLTMAMLFSAIIVCLLLAVAAWFGGTTLPLSQAGALLAVLVLGSVTFCTLGLAIGFLAGPNSAAPIVNLIYLPLGFLSGLWVPIAFLPRAVQDFAYWSPAYHFSQLALHVTGGSRGESIGMHTGAMIVAAMLFGTVAYAAYRRDEGKMYG